MNKPLLTIMFAIAYFGIASATVRQPTQTIRGKVIDADTRVPLIGVSLVLAGTDPLTGTITNEKGGFKFEKLHVGRYNINVFYLGYESKTVSNILLGSGKEVVLNIALTESVYNLEEVTIKATLNKGEPINNLATISARSFTVEETKRYAGSFQDPARMAASYAGVTADPGGNNDIIIRGNSPRGLLWRLEGIEIPNPNHFSEEGATGGPISILNSTTMDRSDFFTGAFPAEYGNAYSGVFDIHLRKGNNQKREYTLQGGLIGFEGAAEGPFLNGGSSSYLINYRYSTLAMFNAVGIKIVGDAVPEFQDLTINLNFPTKKSGTFNLFALGGISKIVEDYANWHNDFSVDMGVMGLSNLYLISDKTYLKTTLAAIASRNLWQYRETYESDAKPFVASENFNYVDYKATTVLNHKFNSRHQLKLGLIYTHKTFNLFTDYYDKDTDAMVVEVEQEGATDIIQAFGNWRYRITENITLNTGAHYLYFNLNRNYSFEPRAGLKWQFHPNHAVSAGFGIHSKVETMTNYYGRNQDQDGTITCPNKNLDMGKARHYVAGYEYRLSKDLMIKTELYYQDLYDVPVEGDTASSFSALNFSYGYTTTRMKNEGTGKNYGLELTVERFFSRSWFFLGTVSLYDSKYRGSDGIERVTRYNGNYVFNVLGGKEFRLGSGMNPWMLGTSIRMMYAGGRRETPIDLEASREAGNTVRFDDLAYTDQYDDFFRLDTKVSFRKEKKKSTHYIELDIQNTTNKLNIMGNYYDTETDQIETWTQMGIIPSVIYRVEF